MRGGDEQRRSAAAATAHRSARAPRRRCCRAVATARVAGGRDRRRSGDIRLCAPRGCITPVVATTVPAPIPNSLAPFLQRGVARNAVSSSWVVRAGLHEFREREKKGKRVLVFVY